MEPASGSALTKLRGLPYNTTETEIAEFFEGFQTTLIHICRRDGRSTGEAYVEFASPEAAADAIEAKQKGHLRHRYIEIFEVPEKNVEHIKQTQGLVESFPGYVLRMRGLPYSATPEDVVEFFKGIAVDRGSVALTLTPEGRPKGEAYVEFPTEEAQKEALGRHKDAMGERYIELFLSTKANMIEAMQQSSYYSGLQRHPGMAFMPGLQLPGMQPTPMHASMARYQYRPAYGHGAPVQSVVSADGSTLRLRGLPYSAGAEEIGDFFSGYSLAHDGIQVVTKPDKDGTQVGTGVAYVRFTSPNEAERARKERHRQQMGARYIECLPFTASHYTSPAALPAQMGPPPPALGSPFGMGMNVRYPGPTAAQRPFPAMAALGRALPAHEEAKLSVDVQDFGASGRGRGRPGRPAQWQASLPGMGASGAPIQALAAHQAALRPGRGQPLPQQPPGKPGPGRGMQARLSMPPEYVAQQQAALQQQQQLLLQQQYLMHQHMLQQQQHQQRYMGAGWSGQYPEAHPGMHSMPMAPSWYQGPGATGQYSSGIGSTYTQGPASASSAQSPHSSRPEHDAAAAATLAAEEGLPAPEEISAVMASPTQPQLPLGPSSNRTSAASPGQSGASSGARLSPAYTPPRPG